MAQTKHGIEDVRININDLVKAALVCHELEIIAAGTVYATIIGYDEILHKLNDADIWWQFDY